MDYAKLENPDRMEVNCIGGKLRMSSWNTEGYSAPFDVELTRRAEYAEKHSCNNFSRTA
jgi:hypothetical protein